MNGRVFNLMFDIATADNAHVDEGFAEYKGWYFVENGRELPDSEQLKWILECPNITTSLKRELSRRIVNKNAALEEEEDVLLKIGHTPENHEKCIEKTVGDLAERFTRLRKQYFVGTAIFIVIDSLIYLCCKLTTVTVFTKIVLLLFFGFAVACFALGLNPASKIDAIKKEAVLIEEGLIGHTVQERIAEIKEEREEFYKLSKIIVKNTSDV